MILEVETLQPRIVPPYILCGHERFEQPFLGDPIHAANERFRFFAQRVEREAPAIENPIGLLVSPGQECARHFTKTPLQIEAANRFPILQPHDPRLGRIP